MPELERCPNCGWPVIYRSPGCSAHQSAQVVIRPRMPKDLPTQQTYSRAEETPPREIPLDTLLAHILAVFRVGRDELLSQKRQRTEAQEAKKIFISCAIDAFHYTQREISTFLGCSIATVDRSITLARAMLRQERCDAAPLREDVIARCRSAD